MILSNDVGIWVQAILIIATWSLILYKETIVSRVVEHTFVAVSMGHYCVIALDTINKQGIARFMTGDLVMAPMMIIGFLMFLRFINNVKYGWLSRYATSLLMGVGIGVAFATSVQTNILNQLTATILPTKGISSSDIISNLVIIVGVVVTVAYFIFTYEGKGRGSYSMNRLGRYFIMFALGSNLGYILLGYLTRVVERLTFIFSAWLGML